MQKKLFAFLIGKLGSDRDAINLIDKRSAGIVCVLNATVECMQALGPELVDIEYTDTSGKRANKKAADAEGGAAAMGAVGTVENGLLEKVLAFAAHPSYLVQ